MVLGAHRMMCTCLRTHSTHTVKLPHERAPRWHTHTHTPGALCVSLPVRLSSTQTKRGRASGWYAQFFFGSAGLIALHDAAVRRIGGGDGDV